MLISTLVTPASAHAHPCTKTGCPASGVTGEHKGFWSWTMHNAGLGLVKEGSLSGERLEELVAEMRTVDASPDTVVAHARMHQSIARKPDRKA
jgi:hypothetical protein